MTHRQNLVKTKSCGSVFTCASLVTIGNIIQHCKSCHVAMSIFPNDWAATVQRSAAAWKDRASTEVKPCTCRKCQMSSICQGDPQDPELCPAEKSFKLLVESVNVNSLRTGNHHLYIGKSTISMAMFAMLNYQRLVQMFECRKMLYALKIWDKFHGSNMDQK